MAKAMGASGEVAHVILQQDPVGSCQLCDRSNKTLKPPQGAVLALSNSDQCGERPGWLMFFVQEGR